MLTEVRECTKVVIVPEVEHGVRGSRMMHMRNINRLACCDFLGSWKAEFQ